jgi:outer membrane protein assembly factor BamD
MPIRFWPQKLYPVQTLFAVMFLVTFFSGCSAVTIDNDSPPEAQYAEGERLLNKDRYLEAVERFRILKSRYPYSKYAALATLRIGDTHFAEEAFLESAAAYKVFRDLYPKHEKTPYAIFRMGESHYNTLPSTDDRDLDSAQMAIDAYTMLMKDFPNSEYEKEAEKRIAELRTRLAEKEIYVGDFYFKRELYQAAANRYSYLLLNYPEQGKSEENIYKLAYSFERMGEYSKADQAIEILEKDYPNGSRESDRKKLKAKVQEGLSK